VLPTLSSKLESICSLVPKMAEQANNLLSKSAEDATEADTVDDVQDEMGDATSSTLTEVSNRSLILNQ